MKNENNLCAAAQPIDLDKPTGQTIPGIHTVEWFNDAFTNPVTGEPYTLPLGLRIASQRICNSYNIQGICDPMYIANVIALELGLGDGKSNFTL